MSATAPHGHRPVDVLDIEQPSWPEYRHLAPWLRTALWGLSSEARVRAREEIAAHFDDALAEGLRSGLSEDDAGKRAVESLGSPRRARWGFWRTYLTVVEQKSFEQIARRDRSMLVIFGLIWLLNAVRLFTEPRWSSPDWALRGALALIGAGGVVALGLTPALVRRGYLRTAVAITPVAFLGFYLSWITADRTSPIEFVKHGLVPGGILFGLVAVVFVSLFLKLPSNPERSA